MTKKIKTAGLCFLGSLGLWFSLPAVAQEKGWGEGNKLEDAEIVVEKNRVNQLPEALRNYEKFKIAPPDKKPRQVTYRFTDYKLADLKLNMPMRVLTIKPEDLPKLYGNYVKLGYGNYNTPYLKGYFHNKRDNQYAYGVDVSHVSSGKGPVPLSGVSNSSIELSGESYNRDLTYGGKVGYGRDTYHFYGFKPSDQVVREDDIEQRFNRIGASVFANNKLGKGPLTYDSELGFTYFSNKYNAKESNISIDLNTVYALQEGSGVNIDLGFSHVAYKDQAINLSPQPETEDVSRSRNFFRLSPAYVKQADKLNLTLGATIGYTNDTIKAARKFNIYPNVRVAYQVVPDNFQVFAGLSGDLERVTLNQLTQENPFLQRNVNVADINKVLELYGGISGNITSSLKFTGRAAYQSFRNLYFFNNSPLDSAKFDVIYDNGTTKVINVFGDISFSQSDNFRLGVKGDYNAYTTDELEKPFHRPAFQSTLYGTYNMYDKIFFTTEFYYISSTFGQVLRNPNTVTPTRVLRETDTIVDLNFKVDYRFSNKFSTFVMANNILGNQYQRFVNYPNKGLQAIVGISYIF